LKFVLLRFDCIINDSRRSVAVVAAECRCGRGEVSLWSRRMDCGELIRGIPMKLG